MCKILWHPQIACFPSTVKNNVFVWQNLQILALRKLGGILLRSPKVSQPLLPCLLREIGSVERCWSYIYYVFLELVWSPVCLSDILLFSSEAMKQAWLPFLEVRECHSARNQNGLTHKAIYAHSVSLVANTSNFPKGRLCSCFLKVYTQSSLRWIIFIIVEIFITP